MDSEELEKIAIAALGEASFAASGMEALWYVAVAKGLISKETAVNIWDGIILAHEMQRANAPGGEPRPIDHALERAKALLKRFS